MLVAPHPEHGDHENSAALDCVRDQDRVIEFYVNVSVIDLVNDSPMGPTTRGVHVAPKGVASSIALVTSFNTMTPGSSKGLVLSTDDLGGDVVLLESKGLSIEGGIREQPMGPLVTFDDLDGNGIVPQTSISGGYSILEALVTRLN